jgi:uracil-DNA glycosylase family protein
MAKRPPIPSAEPFVPPDASLPGLAEAAQGCRGCDLHARATQAVFGEGPAGARMVLVGEQPGDVEDTTGRPFVGPAGRLLDRALAEAGLARDAVYVTNAVKHFSWEARGPRRIHKKPTWGEVKACKPWLEAEIRALAPGVIVCLGATAVQSVVGRETKLTSVLGHVLETPRGPVVATRHPSALLRMTDAGERRAAFAQLVADLRRARDLASRRT